MSIIKNSDVESIREVSKAVKTYAEGIKSDIEKLLKRHERMQGAWSGKQYDQLTDSLVEAKKVLSKQAGILVEISEKIRSDADRLEEANRKIIK